MSHISFLTSVSTNKDEKGLVTEVLQNIKQAHMKYVLFFVSSHYDQELISQAIKAYVAQDEDFEGVEFVGCTSAGEITPEGVKTKSFTAMSMASEELEVGVGIAKKISTNPIGSAKHAVEKACSQLGITTDDIDGKHYAGLVLVDGLQSVEEYFMLGISKAVRLLRVAGGSAGDDFKFQNTQIHARGKVYEDAGVVVIFKTDTPFKIMGVRSYLPSDKKLKITRADLEKRIVYEFNGRPAAEEYAHALGISSDKLNEDIFMSHPIAIHFGDDYYIRSPLKVVEKNALKFFCHVTEGSRVAIMRPGKMVKEIEDAMVEAKQELGGIGAIIAFNCILRYQELLKLGTLEASFDALHVAPVVGFNTYGEQHNGLHMNQTLTLLIFGK